MGDSSGNFDVEKLTSFSEDLVQFLKDKKDSNDLTRCLEDSKSLQSSSDADFHEVQTLLQEYQKKIEACERKTDEAKSVVAADTELDLLEKELQEEIQRDRLLGEELSVVDEIADLERKGVSIEERKLKLKKLKLDQLQAQRKLSLYASVTHIIPNLDDDSIVSGHIVERDKRVVQNFEFHQAKMDAFDTCNSIWRMINMGEIG